MGVGHEGRETELRLGKLMGTRASFQQESDMNRLGCLQGLRDE